MYGVSRLDVCEEVAVVTFGSIPHDPVLCADIFERFSQAGVNIDMVSQAAPAGDTVSISFTCLDGDLRKVLEISRGLREKHPQASALVSSGNCKLQLFGEEMRTQSGVFARALSALAGAAVETRLITTSEVDISLLIVASELEKAREALEHAFGL